ncbi:MAG: carboxypeptidase regulatory-like domain-containing protein [Planctomycetaceae bacterium]|nr:carboxypeptidase regulatory-like domain-containing protein [Planctomycetaceae bacterium]
MSRPRISHALVCFVIASDLIWASRLLGDAKLTLTIKDSDGQPIPARVHLRDEAGQAVKSLGLSDRLDHLNVDGEQTVSVPPGTYKYSVERSPEWEQVSGEVTIADGDTKMVAVVLTRLVDLTQTEWYSGDLHIHRDPELIEQLLRASDLHIGPVITWWNERNHWKDRDLPTSNLLQFDGNRFAHLMAGEDEREGGALLYFGLEKPLDITGSSREFPSPMTFVQRARERQTALHLDIEKPFWWDVPIWLALAKPDTVGLANNHMCRDRMYEDEAWGRPRDAERLTSPRGNGYWTQELYYHILNTGLRIAPSAGSASGVLPNPVGYNRVYVHVDGELTWDKWWSGLRAGRSFVTNGPVLECRANGEIPGTVFQGDGTRPFRVSLDMTLTSQDRVKEVEVIQNGEVVLSLPCDEQSSHQLTAELTIQGSGWFLVRAITDNPRTFRFASTAPFYVELGEQPRRISRASCQFFLDWIDERMQRVPDKLIDPDQLETVLASHKQARDFWRQRLMTATNL